MPTQATTKSPRLIRRGDVIHSKETDKDEIVRQVQIVLQLANGYSESYTVDEMVTLGDDLDLSPAELVSAVLSDAEWRQEKVNLDAQTAAQAAAATAQAEVTP